MDRRNVNIPFHLIFLGVFVFAFTFMANAQEEYNFPTMKAEAVKAQGPGYCSNNQLQLDSISIAIPKDKTLIVIARRGKLDRSASISTRRLSNIRAYLTDGVVEQYRRSKDSIIVAEGESVDAPLGQVEIYVDGRLIVVLKARGKGDLAVAECYAGIDGEPWCATKRQKLFYPCRDHAVKKPKTRLPRKK